MKKEDSLMQMLAMIIILAVITILTSMRVFQKGTNPIVPNIPSSMPRAEIGFRDSIPQDVCLISFQTRSIPSVTPTSIPRKELIIQGRFYWDKDTQRMSIGRGGISASIPICYRPELTNCRDEAGEYKLPFRVDLMTNGENTYLRDIGNHPNMGDVCSETQKQERSFCGTNSTSTHCSKDGGFSFVVDPAEAKIFRLDTNRDGRTEDYYFIRVIANSGYRQDNRLWQITESYWMDTRTDFELPVPAPTLPYYEQINESETVRCDKTCPTSGCRTHDQTQCNTCTGGAIEPNTWARVCNLNAVGNLSAGADCIMYNYKFDNWAGILIPVEGPTVRNLWIGASPK